MFRWSGACFFEDYLVKLSALVAIICLLIPGKAVSGENLLVNSGAETGDINGWVDPDDAWGAASDVTPQAGDYFFWPSRQAIVSTEMYQDVAIDLSEMEGACYMHLSGWLCNWDQYPHDRSTLAIEALDGSGTTLAYYQSEQRSPVWTRHIVEAPVPAGTETIRVHLIATRFVGTDNDGYFDDLILTVDQRKNATVSIASENNNETVELNGELQLTATTSDGVDVQYIWSSSFPSIATVDSNGTITGVAEGRVVIMARGVESHAVGTFEIQVVDQDAIVFLSPKTDTMLIAMNESEVLWNVIGTPGIGTMSLSLDGGVNFTQIEDEIDLSGGAFLWTPNEQETTERQCVLKIAWDGSEAASGIFTILPSSTVPVSYPAEKHAVQTRIDNSDKMIFDLMGRRAKIGTAGIHPPVASGIQVIHSDGHTKKTAIINKR